MLDKNTLSVAGRDDFDGLPRIQTMQRFIASPVVCKRMGSPLGADGGWAGPTFITARQRLAMVLCGDGAAMANTCFGYWARHEQRWCRVQRRRGARHNGGCSNPKGAKRPPRRTSPASERGGFVQQPVMFTWPPGPSNPAATAKVRPGSMPGWPCTTVLASAWALLASSNIATARGLPCKRRDGTGHHITRPHRTRRCPRLRCPRRP